MPDEDDPLNPPEPAIEGEEDPPASTVDGLSGGQEDLSDMVPRARLNQEISKRQDADSRADRLRGQIEGMSKPSTSGEPARSSADEPKVHTRSELRELVEAGRMNEDQMEDILDRQRDDRTARLVQNTVKNTVDTNTSQQTTVSQITEYRKLRPDVMVEGSEDRQKVQDEYDFLVQSGDDAESLSTQLKALRSAFGPVDGLRALKVVPKKETHMEISGGSGSGGNQGGKSKEDTSRPPADLSPDEIAYYEGAIRTGIYSGWAAVHDEMKFADPKVRSRAKARG